MTMKCATSAQLHTNHPSKLGSTYCSLLLFGAPVSLLGNTFVAHSFQSEHDEYAGIVVKQNRMWIRSFANFLWATAFLSSQDHC